MPLPNTRVTPSIGLCSASLQGHRENAFLSTRAAELSFLLLSLVPGSSSPPGTHCLPLTAWLQLGSCPLPRAEQEGMDACRPCLLTPLHHHPFLPVPGGAQCAARAQLPMALVRPRHRSSELGAQGRAAPARTQIPPQDLPPSALGRGTAEGLSCRRSTVPHFGFVRET